ncbi:MAG: ABC transporter substrate-binding protein [Chloroflexi bacterium]|nr:ABC transporter substrate-binding protein [Chloroflexota bacterium]
MLFLAISLLSACGPQEVRKPPDKLTLQLAWVHQASLAGFYLAQERGHYAQENIEVAFIEGGPGINALEQVVTGGADFGVGGPAGILLQRSREKPVVAIAAIQRRSPVVFVALADSGIERPADFLGRSMAAAGPVEYELQLKAMLKKLCLDINQVEVVPHSYDLTRLREGKVDGTGLYLTGGLIRLRQAGCKVNLIWPGDYGVHMYGHTLITTDRMIAENPELVTRFLRATLRGWREAVEDTEAAVAATMKYAREKDSELQTKMMEASQPLIHTGEDRIGWMRAEAWQGMHQILLEQGILAGPVDLDKVYTMEFLQRIYGGKK